MLKHLLLTSWRNEKSEVIFKNVYRGFNHKGNFNNQHGEPSECEI